MTFRGFVSDRQVFVDGVAVCSAAEIAINQFGHEHGYTWAEVATLGVPIWATETGDLYCEDPEDYPQIFVDSMRAHGERFRRVVLDPNPNTAAECEAVAVFWKDRCDANVAPEGRLCITVTP